MIKYIITQPRIITYDVEVMRVVLDDSSRTFFVYKKRIDAKLFGLFRVELHRWYIYKLMYKKDNYVS
jgi:hypothetical protein